MFLYASAIALSRLFPVLLSEAFILNLMQFSVQPSLEMILRLIAFLFLTLSSTSLGSMKIYQNRLRSISHSL